MKQFFQIPMNFILLFLMSFCISGQDSDSLEGTILSVIDGDTFVLQTEEGSLRIRLYGIDAPEMSQPYGEEAKDLLDRYKGKTARVTRHDVDRYGRTVGTLYVQGEDINLLLLNSGLAWFYEKYSDNNIYREAERLARSLGLGLWNATEPMAPWSWRRGTQPFTEKEMKHGQVIICDNNSPVVYHRYLCPGLKRCKAEKKIITEEEAKSEGRKKCKFCWK